MIYRCLTREQKLHAAVGYSRVDLSRSGVEARDGQSQRLFLAFVMIRALPEEVGGENISGNFNTEKVIRTEQTVKLSS